MDIIAKRNEKVAFMELKDSAGTYVRMRGFTEFSLSKNPVEYSRRYIDEKTQRNDVVGYSPSISFAFDKFSDDEVHKELIAIADLEKIGTDTVRNIVIVDMSGSDEQKSAQMRAWSVIPDSEGNDTDAYTYSGTLKSNGEIKHGVALTTDDWQSCTFIEEE